MMRPSIKNNSKNNMYNYNDPFDMMNNMFNDFWGTGLETKSNMRCDVIEEDNDYKLLANLPGFNKDEIDISLKEDVLKVSATHKTNEDEEKKNYIRRERTTTSYERSFRVENVGPQDIKASYENGVLTVVIPKKEPVEPKAEKISIM